MKEEKKIDINVKQFYSTLGVPSNYLNDFSIKYFTNKLSTFDYPLGRKTLKVLADNQYNFLSSYIKKVKQGQASGLFCVCCNNTTLALNFVFALFRTVLQKTFSKKEMKLPYWHTLGQGFTDNVENGDVSQLPNFLVIDHISEKSSTVKIELAKSIANKYNYIPVVMICLTKKPLEFFQKNFLQPSKVIYLDVNSNFIPSKKIKELKKKIEVDFTQDNPELLDKKNDNILGID